jgi:hypothetical protein
METTIPFPVGHQSSHSFAELRTTEAMNTNPSNGGDDLKCHTGIVWPLVQKRVSRRPHPLLS